MLNVANLSCECFTELTWLKFEQPLLFFAKCTVSFSKLLYAECQI